MSSLRPVDALIALYLAFVTVVIVWRGGLAEWANWWLLGMHGLYAVLLALFRRLVQAHRVGRLLHDLYPLILLPALYTEIGVLNLQLDVERIFARDAVVQSWETSLFGGQPSYEWIRGSPSVFWSGLLHLAYLSYYPIVLLGPVLLTARGRRQAARRVLFCTMLGFVACYVVFVLVPVAGPNYAFAEPTGAVRQVWSARLVYGIIANGSSFGAAFPSSHVAASVAAVLALWGEWRGLAAAFVPAAVLLVIGTVYCQMHYVVDVAAGVLVGVAAAWVGRRLTADPVPLSAGGVMGRSRMRRSLGRSRRSDR